MEKIYLTFLGLLSFCVFGQNQTDALLWTGVGVDAKITKDLKVGYKTQTRFNNNGSSFKDYFNQLNVSYDIVDEFSIDLAYRFSRKKKDNAYFKSDNRFMLDVNYSNKFKDLGLKLYYRGRFQYGYDRLNVINQFIFPDHYSAFRFKVKARYKFKEFKRVQPFGSYELFKSLNSKAEYATLSAYRFRGGVIFDLPQKHEVKLYYTYEVENNSKPQINHIYAIQYTYDLGRILKK
ncbi:MAG: DUF2490 domain-containing protein [Putridiphycobacter sp.]